MIWSKEALQDLSEDDLCNDVLIPLFRAMGYQNVRSYHGGVLEQGKDIVMWKNDELRGRINYAVVAKAEKIGGVASIVNTVAFQAQQALGSPFSDEYTQELHQVHEVLVVTSREITKEGDEALRNAWSSSNVARSITKMGGDRLWELVQEYLPHEAIFASLAEASKALAEADPDFGYVAQLEPGRTHLVAFPKGGQRESLPVAFDPKFPDTQEGKEQEEAFRKFIASGRPAEIKAEFLGIKGLPRPLDSILRKSPEGTFYFEPSKSSAKLVVSLILRKQDGGEVVLFPLVEFGSNYAGVEEVTLSNDQQPIPFKFRLRFSKDNGRATFSFDFKEAESSAFSLLRAEEFKASLAQGGTLVFEEVDSGRRFSLSPISAGELVEPGEVFLDMLRKVVWIQRQLGIVLDLPERDFFSHEDIGDILNVEEIIKNGRFWGEIPNVEVALVPGALSDILSRHPDGVLGSMKFAKHYRHNLLGTEIDLGAVELLAAEVRIDPDQLSDLKAFCEQSPQGDSPEVRLVAEHGFEAKFTNWPKESEASEIRNEVPPASQQVDTSESPPSEVAPDS